MSRKKKIDEKKKDSRREKGKEGTPTGVHDYIHQWEAKATSTGAGH
jgi:hypothetical protein